MLENPARVLYERAGFRRVATDEEAAACTMVLELTGRPRNALKGGAAHGGAARGGAVQPGAHQPFGT